MDKQIIREHIAVQGVEMIHQGTNSNGPWHLYKVTTPEKKYSTFLEGLQIGKEYDVLVENKPFKGKKDGKMHDGWTITGFDNVKYEQKQELPQLDKKPAQNVTPVSFPEDVKKMIYDTYRDVQAIKIYIGVGRPPEEEEKIPY